MTATTNLTLFSNPWLTVYNLLVENISDPKSRTKWISNSTPDIFSKTNREASKDMYPWITIRVNNAGEQLTKDYEGITHRVTVEIFTTEAISGDTLAGNVYNTLIGNKPTLRASGLPLFRFEDSDTDEITVSEQLRVHQKTLNFAAGNVL